MNTIILMILASVPLWSSYNDSLGFHHHYFVEHLGFVWGLVLAVVIALISAALFYFIGCNNFKFSKRVNWWFCSVLVAVISFFACNAILIGKKGSDKTFNFHGSNEQLVRNNRKSPRAENYRELKVKIEKDLKNHGDIWWGFNVSCAGATWLCFLGFSAWFKGYSKFGVKIPY